MSDDKVYEAPSVEQLDSDGEPISTSPGTTFQTSN